MNSIESNFVRFNISHVFDGVGIVKYIFYACMILSAADPIDIGKYTPIIEATINELLFIKIKCDDGNK